MFLGKDYFYQDGEAHATFLPSWIGSHSLTQENPNGLAEAILFKSKQIRFSITEQNTIVTVTVTVTEIKLSCFQPTEVERLHELHRPGISCSLWLG